MAGVVAQVNTRQRLLAGMRVGDHLVVRSVLGEGGTAVVYEALHTRLGAAVALKVLDVPDAYFEAAAVRMQREAQLCAGLEDPHVPRVYDIGALDDGTPYVVMEKVSGPTLEHVLAQGRLRLSAIVSVAEDLLRALEAIHRAGVIHRDIKPANLIVKFGQDGSAQLRLMDFGVSKTLVESDNDPRLTAVGTVVGTPHYMAPEQITGEPIDARADLYAAGVVLYEMLAGRTPYEGDTTAEVVAAVLRHAPAPLSMLAPDVSPVLESVVMRAMAAHSRDRYGSARELREALLGAVSDGEAPIMLDRRAGRDSTSATLVRSRVRRALAPRRAKLMGVSLALAAGTMGWPVATRQGAEEDKAAPAQVAAQAARPTAQSKKTQATTQSPVAPAAPAPASSPEAVLEADVPAEPADARALGAAVLDDSQLPVGVEVPAEPAPEALPSDEDEDSTAAQYRVRLFEKALQMANDGRLEVREPARGAVVREEAPTHTRGAPTASGRSRGDRARGPAEELSAEERKGLLISDYVNQLEEIQRETHQRQQQQQQQLVAPVLEAAPQPSAIEAAPSAPEGAPTEEPAPEPEGVPANPYQE